MFNEDEEFELVEAARNALDTPATSGVEVSSRRCENDKNGRGVELEFIGDTIAIRPIIEAVSATENWAVANVFYSNKGDYFHCPECNEKLRQKGITIFCAYNPEEKTDIQFTG